MNTNKEYYAEDLGYCDICDTHTPYDECARCGEEVCIYCHASIGCDA